MLLESMLWCKFFFASSTHKRPSASHNIVHFNKLFSIMFWSDVFSQMLFWFKLGIADCALENPPITFGSFATRLRHRFMYWGNVLVQEFWGWKYFITKSAGLETLFCIFCRFLKPDHFFRASLRWWGISNISFRPWWNLRWGILAAEITRLYNAG